MINEYQAKRYCKEDLSKIENYDKAIADTSQIWDCHHRTEIWWNCSKKELLSTIEKLKNVLIKTGIIKIE